MISKLVVALYKTLTGSPGRIAPFSPALAVSHKPTGEGVGSQSATALEVSCVRPLPSGLIRNISAASGSTPAVVLCR